MSDDSQAEKQLFLRENILDKGYDTEKFVEFLTSKKGEEGANIENWTMEDLKMVVGEFISIQNNNNKSMPIQNIISNDPLSMPPTSNPPMISKSNNSYQDPLRNPLQNPLQNPLRNNTQPIPKANINTFDPLSGGISNNTFNQINYVQNNINQNNQYISQQVQQNPKAQVQNNHMIQNAPGFQGLQNPLLEKKDHTTKQNQTSNQMNNATNTSKIKNDNQTKNTEKKDKNDTQVKNTENKEKKETQTKNTENNKEQKSQQNKQGQDKKDEKQKNNDIKKNNPESEKVNEKNDISTKYGIIIPFMEDSKSIDNTKLSSVQNPTIQIGYPEKVEGGIFSKSYVTYLVTTSPLNIKVRRRYSDFEWLRQILLNLYSGNVIPTIPKKNKLGSDKFAETFLQKRMRTLEKFLNYLLMNPIIKNSQIFYDFISIEKDADFTKKKKEYDKLKPPHTINDNQSITGKIIIEVTKEKEHNFEKIKDNLTRNEFLLGKLNENLKILKNQVDNLRLKINEIAQNWNDLYNESKKNGDGEEIISTYDNMNKLFSVWSDCLKRYNNYYHIDLREYFKYVKNHFKCMKDLVYTVDSNASNYNKLEKNLISKKDELFTRGNISSWKLEPKDNNTNITQNKVLALQKMLPKETINVIQNKKVYGYYLNRMIDEFERIKSINSLLHKKSLVSFCEKIAEIYGDFVKNSKDIINSINKKLPIK